MPALPFAVFRTNVAPEPAEPGAAGADEAADDAPAAAVDTVAEGAADESSDELLHAAANAARAARERPEPTVRSEVLRSMTILMCGADRTCRSAYVVLDTENLV
jgi:hypothetical protein